MKNLVLKSAAVFLSMILGGCSAEKDRVVEYVDYVNPYIGNISHLLVPTYPTVHLPNSMMRMTPSKVDYTSDRLSSLPMFMHGHRRGSVFNMIPYVNGDRYGAWNRGLTYDNEEITPYRYKVTLDEIHLDIDFVPSHQSALYRLTLADPDDRLCLSFPFDSGMKLMTEGDSALSGSCLLEDDTTCVYIFAEFNHPFVPEMKKKSLELSFGEGIDIGVRYGVSYISTEQAEKNLRREIAGYDSEVLASAGRRIWNEALGKIDVEGVSEDDMRVFYTALYRTYERPVDISEDGYYYSGFDHKVHNAEGRPFYVDDWLWDTYRAQHPLRILLDSRKESDILNSYMTSAEHMQNGRQWLPVFPVVTGDDCRMNCNHGIVSICDALYKGVPDIDAEKALSLCESSFTDRTLVPWSSAPTCELDKFYRENGYFPALRPDETETVPVVTEGEHRQAVAVTLGTSYDHWALSRIASYAGDDEKAGYYSSCGLNYRNLFNENTRFFHPKDSDGNFIPGVNYKLDRGRGARHYYAENNAYTYRWEVPHNIPDLIELMGGNESFCKTLDSLFSEPLGMGKFQFYKTFGGDQTGNVGQFSMGNEPSFHIPYLYDYAGQPWKTQKRVRSLLDMWFRDDLMGIPGDEDGGGMSAFVIFSQLGFYPVTPGIPVYAIGSPVFQDATITLSNGRTLRIKADNTSDRNKYIQSVKINGKEWTKTWFSHNDIADGGVMEFVMGDTPNYDWGTGSVPPAGY